MTEKRLGSYNGLEVWHSYDSGYAHLFPLPDQSTVEAYYNDDQFYSQHSPPDWFVKESEENYRGLWDSYYRYLYNIAKEGRVLDWGCGAGWWLKWLYEHTDCNHFGIEPSAMARDIAQAPHIYATEDGLRGKFDVISLQLVLEHIVNPVEFLERISKYLAPGGRLLITVPNEFNPLQRRIGYYGFISPVHVNYFTPVGLRSVLRQAGFKVIYEGATFPMEIFVLLGLNYIGNDILGRKCHNIRLKIEKIGGWRIFKLYKWLYGRWGIGRELVFIVERV